MIKKDNFADLEQIRLKHLEDKIIDALIEFDKDKEMQWISMRFEKILLETILVALEEKLSGGWIPVSERLPSEEECNKFDVTHPNARKFLCTIKVANYEPQVRTIYFSEIVGWKYSAQDYNEYVLAWQPLPKPYKEVEQ